MQPNDLHRLDLISQLQKLHFALKYKKTVKNKTIKLQPKTVISIFWTNTENGRVVKHQFTFTVVFGIFA